MSNVKTSGRALSRRTMLRGSVGAGASVALGLPLLEAMLNENGTALAGGAALPMQFISWFMGNGYRLDQLEPSQVGADFALTPELQPFSSVANYLSIVTGMQNWCYAQVTHHEGMTGLNGYHPAQLSGLFSKAGGPTLDQVIADFVYDNAPSPLHVKSVQVGISKRTSIMDSGTTMHCLSHRGPEQPLFPEFNPQKIYDTLFLDFEDKPDDRALRLSVLSSVKDDLNKLNGRLGAADKQRVEAHLQGIRELEDKINALPPTCDLPTKPTETNQDVNGDEPVTSVNEAMSELLVYALKCDITRVASVFFLGGAAETTYSEIGQNVGHHYNTHDPGAQNAVHNGVVYAHERMAYLLGRMAETVDPTGANLLDTGLVMSTSDCSIGLSHTVSRQPYILVGSLRDRIKTRYHHQVAGTYNGSNNSPNAGGNTSDVLFTILKAFDKDAASIGDMVPRQMQGGWYGSGGNPGQRVVGSNTVINEITGPAFGT